MREMPRRGPQVVGILYDCTCSATDLLGLEAHVYEPQGDLIESFSSCASQNDCSVEGEKKTLRNT